MRNCPRCSAPLRPGNDACDDCGWKPRAAAAEAPDYERWRCCDVERGLRCAKAGTLSPSTTGGGPWYCADHFPAFRSMRAAKIDRACGAQRIGELAARFRRRAPELDQEADLERAAIQAEGA